MTLMIIRHCFLLSIFFQISLNSVSQNGNSFVPAKSARSSTSKEAVALFNEASDSFKSRNYDVAIMLYKKAIAIDTNYLDAYDNLGLTYRQLQYLDSAEYFYRRSFEKDSKNPTPIHNLAIVAEQQNIPRKAMLLYLMLSGMDPGNPEGYFGLSRMYYVLGRDAEAFESGQTAEKLYKKVNSPLIKDCYLVLTVICIRAGKGKLAKKYLVLAKEAGAHIEKELEDAVLKN